MMTPINPLSAREHEVVNQVLHGKSNKQIALALGITVRTVEFHLHNIYRKCGVQSRIELILHLSNTPGSRRSENLGSSTVAPLGNSAEDRTTPTVLVTRASFFSAIVARMSKECIMNAQWKGPIVNGILWAAAIIAAALVGAPPLLSITLLPVLAMASFLVADPMHGTPNGDLSR